MKTGTGKFYGNIRYIVASEGEQQWMTFNSEERRQQFIDAGTPWAKPQQFNASGWSTDPHGSDQIADTYQDVTWDQPEFKVGDRVRVKHTDPREKYRGQEFVITGIQKPQKGETWQAYAIGDDIMSERLWLSGDGVFLENLEHVAATIDRTEYPAYDRDKVYIGRNAGPQAYGHEREHAIGVFIKIKNNQYASISTEEAREMGAYLTGIADHIEADQKIANGDKKAKVLKKIRYHEDMLAALKKEAEGL